MNVATRVRSESGDGVTRNLLPELEEEEEKSEGDLVEVTDLTGAMEEVEAEAPPVPSAPVRPHPPTPSTQAMNTIPLQIDLQGSPARALELLMEKNMLLMHFKVERVTGGVGGDVRDPGFAAMTSANQILLGIIGVFNTAGYSVKIANRRAVLSHSMRNLAVAGQAVYDLFLRHQMSRKIQRAVETAQGGMLGDAEMKRIAEQYMGYSKEEVKKLQEDLYYKDSVVTTMERYMQEIADQRDELSRVVAANAAAARVAGIASQSMYPAAPTATESVERPTMKDEKPRFSVKGERGDLETPRANVTTDYLADIYDDCMQQTQSVSAATRLRQSAVSDLKNFDGRTRDEYKGKSWLSSVRAAFRRDQLSPGEALMQFSDLLSSSAKMWYRQLARGIRASWPALQAEFESEYCGTAVTAQEKYFQMKRKPNEEALDYLYRLNVQASEANIDFSQAGNAPSHVRHFINTCDDVALAVQLTGLRLTNQAALKDTLRDLQRTNARVKRDEGVQPRASKREDKPVKPIKSSKVIAKASRVQAIKSKKAVSFCQSDEESVCESSEEENLSSSEESSTSDDDAAADLAKVLKKGDGLEQLSRIFTMLDGRTPSPKPKTSGDQGTRRQTVPCSHCGSQRHRDLDCWRRLTCQACGRTGHPTDHCFQRCKGCHKVHDRGECPLEELVAQLKTWYDPVKHAGMLPSSVEKSLN